MAVLMRSPAVTLALFVTLVLLLCTASYGRFVGGKTEIRDVRNNKEVQDLGRFSVEEYNQKLRAPQKGKVQFVEVVEAQEQVVSGIKYYLKISANENGAFRIFDSEVVVKPWIRSKQLLTFAPSFQ